MLITRDTIIGDILDLNAQAAVPLLREVGMNCLGCPSARSESVGQACEIHGEDADALISKLNNVMNQ
ncbi:MAG: DUF1858 domain-containing protein [Oscillospiraceae bacterium]|nr:DUF1858 domain-containing protein [Oscillospiraceae bacterium]